jgi:hypothetical protein
MPILLHGLSDFSWQFLTTAESNHIVLGGFDWSGTLVDVLLSLIIGGFLLTQITQPRFLTENPILLKLGLVE